MTTAIVDHLARIVERKQREVTRRMRRGAVFAELAEARAAPLGDAVARLRRPAGERPRVIAEIKLKSPSAGQIRPRRVGEITRIAQRYEDAGASAISVLCDGWGFGGAPLDLRRVVQRVTLPVLCKEFVLAEVQLDLARALGASLVLLLVRVLDDVRLKALVAAAQARGLAPVVEAADEGELTRALATSASIIGINARDLRSFHVDTQEAARLVAGIPDERVAVFMSGVRSPTDFSRIADTRADAVLIGEGLMRANDPGQALAALLAAQ